MQTTSGESGRAFFNQRETHAVIKKLSESSRFCIYAGAGVTINRSGLDWPGMVDAILESNGSDENGRKEFIKRYGPLRAASTATQLIFEAGLKEHGSDYLRQEIASILRRKMYANGSWLDGRLARNIAVFAYTLLRARPDRSAVCLVTPNYDDFLNEILQQVRLNLPNRGWSEVEPAILYPTTQDPLQFGAEPRLSGWVTDPETHLFAPGRLSIVHLHGRVTSSSVDADQQFPVISETDYGLSTPWTEKALQNIFQLPDVETILLGTSVADTPLINALGRTKNRKPHRHVLVCKQGDEDLGSEEHRRLVDARFEHIGVTPIYPDYYIQAAQLMQEIATCVELGDPDEYTSHSSTVRYGRRLGAWWSEWTRLRDAAGIEEHQYNCHSLLRKGADLLRMILNSPAGENLKVEIWLRWTPETNRELKLWASSSGTWPDVDSMREGYIPADDEYLSVRSFREGRPLILDGAVLPAGSRMITRRWQSFLSAPIWNDASAHGGFPVGVITLASSRAGAAGSLTKKANRDNIETVINCLEELAFGITSPQATALEDSERLIDDYIRDARRV